MVQASQGKPLVVITGVTGYLGLHVLREFLQDGSFRVRGTVRFIDETKLAPIKEAMGDLYANLEIVKADLMDKESIERAIDGATYVVHTASPFPLMPPKNADDLVQPAREGTMAVVRAVHEKKVKRLVITSSCAAIMDRAPEDRQLSYNEEHWSDVAHQERVKGYYAMSKTLAEKAAWDYHGSLPEQDRFELVTINPSFIMGKPLHVHGGFASGEFVSKLFTGQIPVMQLIFPMVRVEDVALAHLRAIKVPEAANQRFILNAEHSWARELSQSMADEFNPQGFNVKTQETPYCLVYVLSFCVKELGQVLSGWGYQFTVENKKAKEVLKIEFRPVKEGVNEMIYAMLDAGLIEDKR